MTGHGNTHNQGDKTMNTIQMASKLLECRDAVKSLFGEKYIENLQPYMRIIKEIMRVNNINEIRALLIISKTETYQDSETAQIMFMASVVELIEPLHFYDIIHSIKNHISNETNAQSV